MRQIQALPDGGRRALAAERLRTLQQRYPRVNLVAQLQQLRYQGKPAVAD